MPCYDDRNSSESIRKDFRHNSDVAEMLCALCAKHAAYFGRNREPYPVTEKDALDAVHPGLFAWWEEHKARDAKKKADDKRFHSSVLAQAEIARVSSEIMRKHGLK